MPNFYKTAGLTAVAAGFESQFWNDYIKDPNGANTVVMGEMEYFMESLKESSKFLESF